MKDITITAHRQKTELYFLLGSFIAANILNAAAIVSYGAPASEMLTSIFYVIAFTVFLYLVTVAVRLIMKGITNITSKNKKSS